jgi:hypothetical protein
MTHAFDVVRSPLRAALLLSGIAAAATPALADGAPPLTVQFSRCTEFVGLVPIDAVKAQVQLPSRYALVVDAAGARLVVRLSDCEQIRVGSLPPRPGRLAQIGLLIVSPDGTATDPNTAINNYTLSYASNVGALVLGLRAHGVPAALDADMAYEITPSSGTAGELYAAVAPEFSDSPRFFLEGSVNTPGFGTTFLANWWRLGGGRQTKMETSFPAITFDFASAVSFTTSRRGIVGALLPANRIVSFPVSYRGAYETATMLVQVAP